MPGTEAGASGGSVGRALDAGEAALRNFLKPAARSQRRRVLTPSTRREERREGESGRGRGRAWMKVR